MSTIARNESERLNGGRPEPTMPVNAESAMTYSSTVDNLRKQVAQATRVLRSAAADLERCQDALTRAQADYIKSLADACGRGRAVA